VVRFIVTTPDKRQFVKIKALGCMGLMVQGAHHQPRLMMANGEIIE
jgi:hypothetical protein